MVRPCSLASSTITDPSTDEHRALAISRAIRSSIFRNINNQNRKTLIRDSGIDESTMKGNMAIFKWMVDRSRDGRLTPKQAKALLMKELEADREHINDKIKQCLRAGGNDHPNKVDRTEPEDVE
jgi:hypothetical protein